MERDAMALTGVRVIVALMASWAICSSANAATISFQDGSFEDPVVPAGSFTSFGAGAFLGGVWAVGGNGVAVVNTNYSFDGVTYNSQSGNQSLDLAGIGANAGTGGSVSYQVTL
jgi:hypothetical protein